MKRSARGVPLDEGWYQRLRAMPALIIPLTHNALNDLAVRGAALDMRAFRINNRRTTLWAPADSTLQRVARYAMILLMLAEFGRGYGYVRTVSLLPDTLNASSVLL